MTSKPLPLRGAPRRTDVMAVSMPVKRAIFARYAGFVGPLKTLWCLLERHPSARDDSGQSADPVVPSIVGELDLAEGLQERRHVHAEPAAVALAEAVPPANWVIG